MDSLLKFLKDKIVDKMPLEEIVDVFEQMCSIPLEDDMILFETGTFSTSRHNLMALLSTVATSLRHTPRHTITIPTASSAACAAVFIPYFILSSPSGLCRYHIIVDIRFLLRKIFTQNLSVSCIMRTAG